MSNKLNKIPLTVNFIKHKQNSRNRNDEFHGLRCKELYLFRGKIYSARYKDGEKIYLERYILRT